jgi:hypothetical protein
VAKAAKAQSAAAKIGLISFATACFTLKVPLSYARNLSFLPILMQKTIRRKVKWHLTIE